MCMALHTEACTVIRTNAGLSGRFEVNVFASSPMRFSVMNVVSS